MKRRYKTVGFHTTKGKSAYRALERLWIDCDSKQTVYEAERLLELVQLNSSQGLDKAQLKEYRRLEEFFHQRNREYAILHT